MTKLSEPLSLFNGLGEAPGPVSKSTFARMIGVTKGRVSQLITKGLPVRPDGRIDPVVGCEWVDRNLDPLRRRAAEVEKPVPVESTRAQLETEKLRSLRLENDRREGSLVDRAAAEQAIFARARAERDAHLNWIVQATPQIAAEMGVDARRMGEALERHMRQHLERLAETPLEILTDDRRDLG